MTDFALPGSIEPARRRGPDLDRDFHPAAIDWVCGKLRFFVIGRSTAPAA